MNENKMTTEKWYEDDEFWKTWGPMMFSSLRVKNTHVEVDRILSLVRVPSQARILDLCCGVGRHSLELARRGFAVTGVDRTRGYLDQAKQQANREGLKVEFVQDDMSNFHRRESFDLVLNLFTSFGYFEDRDDDRRVARNIYDSLKPGGILLMDMSGKEIVARTFTERDWHEVDGVYWLEERKIIGNWERIWNRWIMFKDGRRFENVVCPRLYSAVELGLLLGDAGFSNLKVYGDFEGGPYDNNAKRLVCVANK